MTTATISKEFTFSASHRLNGLPADHPCSRLHGHNYTVRLQLEGHTDSTGFVIDYRDLGFFKDMLDEQLDHQDLNDVMGKDFNPTAENLAHELLDVAMAALRTDHVEAYNRLVSVSVGVSETPKTWAVAISARPEEFPITREDYTRNTRHWATLDPHLFDEERFRWNFDNDGSGK